LALEEARRLLATRWDRRFLRLVHVALATGARPGELAALRPEDVELGRDLMTIRRSHERATTKTHRERAFAIPRCARRPLEEGILDGGPVVFLTRVGTQRHRQSSLSRHFRHLLEQAGIERRVTFYDLRHTAATLHREAGCDPLVIRRTLGHASKNLTDDLYSHVSVAYQAAELSKLCICGKCT
jgi:integrase